MVIICAAPGCSVKKDNAAFKKSITFHRFPLRKPDLLAKWVKAMKNPNFKPTVTTYLCSSHFVASDYDIKPSTNTKFLKPFAVPTKFDKKKRGKKEKITEKNENLVGIRTQKDSEAEDHETEQLSEENEAEETLEEFLEVEETEKVEADLAEIIGDQEKGTLQVFIVGEDGKITNSQYIFKKGPYSDEDSKQDVELLPFEEQKEFEYDMEVQQKENEEENECYVEDSSEIEKLQLMNMRNEEKIKKLKNSLMSSRQKKKLLEMKCVKMSRTIVELKILLKLLVLKRGHGVQNLKSLVEKYEKFDSDI